MSDMELRNLVQESLDAFNQADWKRWKKNAAPNAVYEGTSGTRSYTGHDEILGALKAWRKAFPDLTGTIREQYVDGNTVVTELNWKGTHEGKLESPAGTIPPSGRTVKLRSAMISRVRDGKIVKTQEFFDFFEMLRQIDAVPALKTKKAGA